MRATFVVMAGVGLLLAASPALADSGAPVAENPSAAADTTPGPRFSDDRVILRFRAGVAPNARQQAFNEVGVEDSDSLGKRFQVVTLDEGVDIKQAIAEFKANPDVIDAARDGYADLHATNDPLYNQLWGLENQGLNVGGVATSTPGDDISAVSAWTKTTGSDATTVAVLDTGFRPQHPDLKDRLWTNADEIPGDSIDNDGNGYVDDVHGMDFVGADGDAPTSDNDPTDDIPQGGHGVHTAGTIAAAGNNGVGITGVAQKASIMPLRVCGWFTSLASVRCPISSTIAAINYAGANGARVANLSLGGLGFNTVYRDAFAANPNTLFVVSAGNDGKDVELAANTTYPCSYDPSTSGIAGAVDNIICVAASDQNDARASFSNWGKFKVDVAAPGTETLSTYLTNTKLTENFQAAGSPVGWTLDGWTRVSGAPLNSFGMTNTTATQTGGTTRTLRTPSVTVTGPTTCTILFWRKLTSTGNDDQAINDKFTYGGVVGGNSVGTVTGINQSASFFSTAFDVPAGSQQIGAQFNFRKGLSTSANNGIWIDDVGLSCYAQPGQEDATSYTYLQGTSMAAPHVSGEATLLAAYEPTATVTQMRNAVLSSVDPVAMFNPTTGTHPISTGGRANADEALTALDKVVAPQTQFTSTPGASSGPSTSFGFKTTSQAAATFECKLDAGSWAACTSVRNLVNLSSGSHTFSVRALDSYANVDATPASHTWNVVASAPTVLSVAPASGPAAGGTSVTVTGTGFTGTPTVSFGGTLCSSVNRTSATSLTCTTNARVAGAVTVTVTNPDAQSGSKANAFTYLAPAPTVSGVSPASGPVAGGTGVTVTGTGFTGTPTVTFGGAACTSVNRTSATSLTCLTPARPAGSVTVVVTNSDTQSGSKASAFTYVAAPTVTAVSPTSGPAAGGTTVTVTGTGFTGTPTVTFGGAACTSVNRTAATSLTCVTPARPAGAVTVVVTNADTQSGSKASAFTYVAAPTVTSVSPAFGPAAGGTTVTVTGTGFTGTPTVTFGSASCTSVNRTSATSLTCVTPAGVDGPVAVKVTNADGQNGSKAGAFTYNAAPTLTDVTPNSGPMAGGTRITLTGTNFRAAPTVTVDGQACTEVNRVNASTVECVTPPADAPIAVGVTLTNSDGQGVTKASAFTYLAPAAPVPTPPGGTPVVPINPPAPAGPVTGLKAKRIKKGKAAAIKWNAAANAVRYEYGCVVKGKKVKIWVPAAATKATCRNLKPTKAYGVFVRAIGQNSFSAPASVTLRRWR